VSALPEVLEAGLLTLVRERPDDGDEVLAAVRSSFAELQAWMDWAQTMPTRDELRALIVEGGDAHRAGASFRYLCREVGSGEVVGATGVHRTVGPGAVEVSYWVRTDRLGRGYATSAAGAVTDAALTHLADVDRVELHIDVANGASARVAEKLGYRVDHTERQEPCALASTGQVDVWQLRRDDWQPQTA